MKEHAFSQNSYFVMGESVKEKEKKIVQRFCGHPVRFM